MHEYDRLKKLLRDIYFNAIHCDRSVSTCQ